MPCSQDGQTDLASCVYIRVESCSSAICSFCFNLGRFAGVFAAEDDIELEEAVFIRRAVRTDDEGADMANIFFLASNCDGFSDCQSEVFHSLGVRERRLKALSAYIGRCPVGSG